MFPFQARRSAWLWCAFGSTSLISLSSRGSSPGPIHPRIAKDVVLRSPCSHHGRHARGTMGPGHEARDDICGCGRSRACTPPTRSAPRSFGPGVLRHSPSCPCNEAGAGRQGPYHCTFGDAAPAVPHASNGLPAASPRSSKPGGEPAYADRWQQTRHGFADVSCPFEAPGPRTSPSSWMRPAPGSGCAEHKRAKQRGDYLP